LSGTGAEVVIGTAVEVTAQTADLVTVTWFESDVYSHGAIPLDDDSVLCLDIGVGSSLNYLIDGSLWTSDVFDDWCCSSYQVEGGVKNLNHYRLGANQTFGSTWNVFSCDFECLFFLFLATILSQNV
jgi:hypothetical protein